jgi:hypothetical protein
MERGGSLYTGTSIGTERERESYYRHCYIESEVSTQALLLVERERRIERHCYREDTAIGRERCVYRGIAIERA